MLITSEKESHDWDLISISYEREGAWNIQSSGKAPNWISSCPRKTSCRMTLETSCGFARLPDLWDCQCGTRRAEGCIYFCLVQRLQCIIKSSLQYIFGHGTAITRTILPKNRAVTLDRISVFRIYLPGMKYNWFRKQLYGVLGCSARTSIPFGRGPGDSSQREGR
jgi:hypothetical protein